MPWLFQVAGGRRLIPGLRVHLDPLGGHCKAQEVEQQRQQGEQTCHGGEPAGVNHLVALLVGVIDHEGRDDADDDGGEHAAHGAKHRQGAAVLLVVGEDGGHAAVGDVDGGIEHGAPQQIGDKHIGDLDARGRVHQKGTSPDSFMW